MLNVLESSEEEIKTLRFTQELVGGLLPLSVLADLIKPAPEKLLEDSVDIFLELNCSQVVNCLLFTELWDLNIVVRANFEQDW